MKAIVIDAFGGLDKLHEAEVPDPVPVPGRGEVVVRVKAAGVEIWDALQRSGELPIDDPAFPLILGAECAGTIETVGADVQGLRAGDAVYTYFYGKQGAYAEKVAVAADAVAPKPERANFVEAAALPTDAITAHTALVDELQIAPGQTVFIAGASGGVGTVAVQIARALGARVVASTSAANRDYVSALGADDIVDYHAGDAAVQVRALYPSGVDAALDAVGGASARTTIRAVKAGGRFAELTGEDATAPNVTVAHVESKPSAERLRAITALIDDRKLHAEIAQTFPLAEARAAQELVESRHVRGKVVLRVE
jgi:NADPH:quinone reductase-like Zn-dependent oxidoreductase